LDDIYPNQETILMLRNHRIAGIILAAGKSSRMGATKQLLPFGNTNLLTQVISNALAASVAPLITVLGYRANDIQEAVDFTMVEVVLASDYEKGQSASLKAGLSRVPADCGGAIFLLGDQPFVSGRIIDALILAYRSTKQDILIPTVNGRRGTPVLIARPLFEELFVLEGDTGARVLFEKYADRILEVEIGDPAICIDIDTWAEYQNAHRFSG
jgi:molybdenum cofactor cytidylyltransferase